MFIRFETTQCLSSGDYVRAIASPSAFREGQSVMGEWMRSEEKALAALARAITVDFLTQFVMR